jgi:hypothetical protein
MSNYEKKNLGLGVFVRHLMLLRIRVVLIIDQMSQGGYTVQNVVIHTYGYVPIGQKQRQDGARIVANIIKQKMEMDGSNSKGHYPSREHIRLKYRVLLFARRAKYLTSQNGPFVRSVLLPVPLRIT